MRNVEDVIILLFKHVSSVNILAGTNQYPDSPYCTNIPFREFERLASGYLLHYSGSEREALYEHLMHQYEKMETIRHGWRKRDKKTNWDVFSPLFLFAESVLLEEHSQIMCHYEHLISWRKVTREISEELLVTAFCAMKDVLHGVERKHFDWKLVIGNNNLYLNKILAEGVADNHFHLWASAPVFQLSWVRLMNDIENPDFAGVFREMDENRRRKNIRYSSSFEEVPFAVQHLQAVIIRLFLYSCLTEKRIYLSVYRQSAESVTACVSPVLKQFMQSWIPETCCCTGEALQEEFCTLMLNGTISGSADIPMEDKEAMFYFLGNMPKDWISEEEWANGSNRISFWDLLTAFLKREKMISLEWIYPILKKDERRAIWFNSTEAVVKNMLQDPVFLSTNIRKIQNIIEGFRRSDVSLKHVWDYALIEVTDKGLNRENAVWYLNGERWFLYQMFRRISKGQEPARYFNWFYAYLVIQGNIRGEMAQINSEVGLQNFILYEQRKGRFLQQEDWKKATVQMAVASTLHNQHIKQLEARITPCNTAEQNRDYISGLDGMIDPGGKLRSRYYYVMHFVKEAEPVAHMGYDRDCRSKKVRCKVEKQAREIASFRERYPAVASRLKGIDAAAQEIGCRPEVFAQAFRYLRAHTVERNLLNQEHLNLQMLGITYHVGEDFMDLTDGLRAVHEAIRFLNLDCGDRLGHALALGIDVEDWYKGKNNRILISQQDYLDNLAWMHGRITRFHIQELELLLHDIEREFERYFKIVYTQNMDMEKVCNIDTYYSAWKLRSDNPDCYKKGYFEAPELLKGDFHEFSVNNRCPRASGLRGISEISHIYHTYHFNQNVKLEGTKKIEIKISPLWIEGVKCVQKEMQQLVADCGISIETNPSSNFNIGTFRDYAKHPIVKWYNAHLTPNQEALRTCAQISVSINTDDQGIFSTSLENEYALLACALEQERDADGNKVYMRNMVYEWLDEVRKMGIRQGFV